jgi:tRNA dimethylallyltransferase
MPRAAVIALFGPTGVGKTEVAIALADGLRELGERPLAVSADALQVYRGLEILTGAATAQQRARLEHRLIGFVPIQETFSAGRYAQLAQAEIDGALAEGRRPIVVGGTGLYLRAALTELELRPPPDPAVRERWARRMRERGPLALHTELARRAPWAAEAIAPTDRQRIVRALELDEMGELRDRDGDNELWTASTRVPTLLAGLVMDREALYRRIDARVDAMIAAGAREEVLAAAADASPTARGALGF